MYVLFYKKNINALFHFSKWQLSSDYIHAHNKSQLPLIYFYCFFRSGSNIDSFFVHNQITDKHLISGDNKELFL
jgi:hypothetical protein